MTDFPTTASLGYGLDNMLHYSKIEHLAWEVFIELELRIIFQELKRNEGFLDEALRSVQRARDSIATVQTNLTNITDDDTQKFNATLEAIKGILSAFSTEWDEKIKALYATYDENGSTPRSEHERQWELHDACRTSLEAMRQTAITQTRNELITLSTANLTTLMPDDDDSSPLSIDVELAFDFSTSPLKKQTIRFIPNDAQQRLAELLHAETENRYRLLVSEKNSTLRELLSIIYNLFTVTRERLKAAGPAVADSSESLGVIVMRVINEALRPTLAYWHIRLNQHKNSATPPYSQEEAIQAIARATEGLKLYMDALETIAKAPLYDDNLNSDLDDLTEDDFDMGNP